MEAQYLRWQAQAMKRVCVVCEGQTEETFVSNVLAPAFYGLGLNLIPQMIATSPGHRGGALSYERVKRHLRNTLRQKSAPTVTTFFDLYRLDKRFPGFDAAQQETLLARKLDILRGELSKFIVAEAECLPTRFIAHIQPYEFEGLLFSDVATLVSVEKSWATAQVSLSRVRAEAETPEHINDQPETKPAAHLARLLKSPKFSKLDHGPIAAAKMGLTIIEAECKFFAAWSNQLRNLSNA
jgi:hypothetical protein